MQHSLEHRNNLTIHQAYYGEINRSHGCIYTTINDLDLKSFLTAFTDRPSSLPSGIALEPYYSGIAYGNFYIFTITFPDKKAPRSGMVFTHALIIQLNDLDYINDLETIFHYFISAIPSERSELTALSIEVFSLRDNKSSETFPEYIQQTVEKLISFEFPVIFCGCLETFKNTLTSIWSGLPFSFRIKFSFTAGFSTSNLDNTKTIVHFQKSLNSILKNQIFISDDSDKAVNITSDVEKYLLQSSINNSFESFLADLKINLIDWPVLSLCVKAFQLFSKLNLSITKDELKLLIRNVAKISDNPTEGISIKNEIISKLIEYISTGVDQNIKSLRNLPLEAFDQGIRIVSELIRISIKKEFQNESTFNVDSIADLCLLANRADLSNWWCNAVESTFHEINEDNDSKVIGNIWELLAYSTDSLVAFIPFIPVKRENETLLIKYIPQSLPENIAKTLVSEIKKRKWFLLHAYLLLKYNSPKNAIVLQIEFEETWPSSALEGTLYLFRKLSDEDLVSLTFSENKQVLIHEFAQRTVNKPILLSKIDINNAIWLKIWSISLTETRDISHGIINPRIQVEKALVLLSDGMNIPENILSLIANSKYADISDYFKREKVWHNLPYNYKPFFLEATVNGLIGKLVNGSVTNVDLESELRNYISSDSYMTSIISKKKNDIPTLLTLYEHVNGLNEHFLADYIKDYSGSLNEVDSSRLGNLIFSNGFKLSAKQVFEKAKRNENFKVALSICKSLLSFDFWDTLFYGHLLGETVTENSIFSALLETSVSLYDKGPEDKDIWKRSGGDISKLHNFKTREENWRQALYLLRNGGGGKHITPKAIVNEMLEDYPNNTELKEILKYFKK